jgi:hypothetical protein
MAPGWKIKTTTTYCGDIQRSKEEELFNNSTTTNKQTEE